MEVFKKYKLIWFFLLRFLVFYGVGLFLYQQYINYFLPRIDPFSDSIAQIIEFLLGLHLPNITLFYVETAPIISIQYLGNEVVNIIEGCNATSVGVLFVAFLVAFKAQLKSYIWFVPLGLSLLFLANIMRIYLLCMVVLYYNDFVTVTHDIIFPGIIYGMVFLLWVFWVKKIVPQNEE